MGDNMNNEEMGYPGQRFSAGSGSSSMDPFAPNPAALQYVPNEFGITHSETSPMYRYNNPAEPDSGAASQTDNYYPGQQYGQNHQYGQNQMYGQNPQYGQNQMYGQSQPYGQGYDQETMNPQGKKAKSSGSNVLAGLVGAFLGSLVGVVLWLVVYKLGYIAGISGAVMVICAMMGYNKFGKKLDLKGIIICVVLCIGMIYISERLSVSMELYQEFSEYGYDVSFFDCYKSMYDVLDAADTMSSFWGELAVGYLLFVVASVSYIINSIRTRAK